MITLRLLALCAIAAFSFGAPQPAKIRVLLDTDAFNEMDDQFFIAYALAEKRFEIEGICATQYRVTEASVDRSYYEARRILDLTGRSAAIPLRIGSDLALEDPGKPRSSPASRFIIERALARDPRPLWILAVGALTNVASALLEEPSIRDRIRVIWLGGSRWPEGALDEFNAANDRAAVKGIVEAGLDLTQIPTETCARQLHTTFEETERRLRHRGPLAAYLIELYRDYGHDWKVLWDMTAVACLLQHAAGERYFDVTTVRSPQVELPSLRYTPNPRGASMKVCTKLDREKILDDFFGRFPPPEDRDPPYLTLAAARGDLRRVTLTFNEDLDPASVGRTDGYRFVPAVPITRAEPVDPRTVRLVLGADLDPATSYTVTSESVTDRASPPNRVGARRSFTFRPRPDLGDGLRIAAGTSNDRVRDVWIRDPYPPGMKERVSGTAPLVLEGFLEAPVRHEYEISCYASGDARIELGGKVLLEVDRRARIPRRAVSIVLERGLHPLRISFQSDHGAPLLNLYWTFPFHEKRRIPWNYLCSPRGPR